MAGSRLCAQETSMKTEVNRFALAIHGGAGTIERSKITPDLERAYRDGLQRSLRAGYDILEKGGSSLDAVEAAVRVLEDDPHFNAGKGAVFTEAGTNELDAAIMDGKTLKAGAVASVKHIKNPISLARMVMEKSPHVMMDCAGAEAFAKQNGVELVDQKYFYTEERWQALQRVKDAARKAAVEAERCSSFPIRISMERSAQWRSIKPGILQQQLPPAGRRTKKRVASAIHRSSARALMRIMQPARFLPRAMENISSALSSVMTFPL